MAHTLCLSCVVTLLAYLAGLCAQLPLFCSADGTVLLAVFLIYLVAMDAYAFAVAMAVRTVKASMVPAVGMMLVCITLAALSHTPTTNAVAYIWWEPAFPLAVSAFAALLLPPLSLLKVNVPDMWPSLPNALCVLSLRASSHLRGTPIPT